MELKRAIKIRDLEVEAKQLRSPIDLAETESQKTPVERWDALERRIEPYLSKTYIPGKKGSNRSIKEERTTKTIEVSPADESAPATYLQITSHEIGPYLRATYSYGEFPDGSGHLPGVKPELNPITEAYSPTLIRDGFDESLALGLLTAVEQSVEVFCNAQQAE